MLCVLPFAVGCGPSTEPLPEKAPRPVSVVTLEKQSLVGEYVVSGAVKSWKTEEIGFEVPGRVEWVLEPGEDIETRISDPNGEWFVEGTEIAKLDPTKYEIALESARANYEVADLDRQTAEILLEESLPSSILSANANLDLALTDFSRVSSLNDRNAASDAEVDQAENRVQTLDAQLTSLRAQLSQASGRLKAAEAEVKRAGQAVLDAERDLANTSLYASYRGQISKVHVVPGSVVTAGSPVLTLEMMDPIKIEVELSSEKSREFRRRRQVPVRYKLPDGTEKPDRAFVYNVATSADAATRTFSLTLLLINNKYRPSLPQGADGVVPRTEDIWPLELNRVLGAPEQIRIVEKDTIIDFDTDDPYVYRVVNSKYGETLPELLEVEKQPIRLLDLEIPFLGIWTFHHVEFVNSSLVDSQSLIIGELSFDDNSEANWDGSTVMLDSGSQWVLRPGDLVDVDLSGKSTEPAFYVPLNAIDEQVGETFVFGVKDNRAAKIPVEAVMLTSLERNSRNKRSLVEVRSPELVEGMEIVVAGAHYLEDGDVVRPMVSALLEEQE